MLTRMAPTTQVVPKTVDMSLSSARKRKLDALRSPDSKKDLFPLFASPSSSPSKCRSTKSPLSMSPSKKKSNPTLKQGAHQNNKILRYMQPKRLLPTFENCDSSRASSPRCSTSKASSPSITHEQDDKENKLGLDLRVSLVRIDDTTFKEHSYCIQHRSPKKFCCNAASEFVVQVLSDIVIEEAQSPCKRLGIPVPACISSLGCSHSEDLGMLSSYQDTVYATMLNTDLQMTMIRSAYNNLSKNLYPSPPTVHCVFKLMKESADQSIVALGRSFLKRTLDLYPPCTPKLRNYYIHVLNSSVNKVTIPVGLWSLRSFEYFDSVLMELEQHIEGLLNPSQLREKMKVPGIRKIVKPKRFTESVSPKKQPRRGSRRESNEVEELDTDISELKDFDLEGLRSESQRKKQLAEDAIKAMSPEEKTSHIFSRFEILVDILERDLVIWFSRNSDYSKIRDRLVCPLVVMALWKPESDTGFDSVHCRRILALYGSAWMLQLHPHHLRTLSRLVGLIAEITAASEPNIGNVYPHVGDGCENLARKFGDVLSSTQMMPMKTKAVANLKPEWLRMLVSANMLRVNPSASSMMQ